MISANEQVHCIKSHDTHSAVLYHVLAFLLAVPLHQTAQSIQHILKQHAIALFACTYMLPVIQHKVGQQAWVFMARNQVST